MLDLDIKKVGKTFEHDGEFLLITDGDMPADCVVVFMDKESWEKLKKEIPK